MVRPRLGAQHGLQLVQHHLGGFVAVGMGVDLHALRQGQRIGLGNGLGRRIPKAVGGSVVVARPAQPGREALDGAIGHHLDASQTQLLSTSGLQRQHALHGVGRRHAHQAQQRHDAQWVGVLTRDPQQLVHLAITQRGGQVGGCGDASAHTQLPEGANAEFVTPQEGAAQPHHAQRRPHGIRPLQLSRGQTVRPQRNAGMRDARAQQPRLLQRRRVDVQDVATGVHHAHGLRTAHAVQVVTVAAALAEVDRIEPPAYQRCRRVVHCGSAGGQGRHHRLQRGGAGDGTALRVEHAKVAAISEAPESAGHQVAVALHQPGHQHPVGKALVQLVRPPACQVLQGPHAQDAPIAHRHMRGLGPGRVHGQDAAGGVDGGRHG